MSDYNADPAPLLPQFRKIAFDLQLVPQTDLKIDQFSTSGTNKVFHFVRKIGSTRLQFLVDPSQIPI